MTIKDIDYDIRKLNSVILRIILLVTLCYIIYFNWNYFTIWTYLCALIGYVILVFLNTINKFLNYRGFCRSILDLSLIVIFLYGKDLFHVVNYLPFTILLFNISNHSNRKSNLHIFIPLLHISIFIIDNFSFRFTHHLIPVVLYIFLALTSVRQFILNVNEEIISVVGEIFISGISDFNIHKILRAVKRQINERKFGKSNVIDEIYLFKVINENLVLVRGTKFLQSTRFDTVLKNRDKFLSVFKNKNIYRESNITVENTNHLHNYWIKINLQQRVYLVLLTMDSDSIIFRYIIFSKIRPVFEYVVRIYYIIESLVQLRKEASDQIKEKMTHILDAQNALHFVRNKLTPITTTISLVDRYFKGTELDLAQKTYIEQRLRENKNLENIRIILTRADILIGGVASLVKDEALPMSFKQVIDDLRENWLYEFDNLEGVIVIGEISGVKINYNQALFGYVLTDIISNLGKYSGGGNKVVIERKNSHMQIIFCNNIYNYDKLKLTLYEIESQYNNQNNDEIYSRKTHGLNFVRSLLRKKRIYSKIFIDKEIKTFNFEIRFEIIDGNIGF